MTHDERVGVVGIVSIVVLIFFTLAIWTSPFKVWEKAALEGALFTLIAIAVCSLPRAR